MKPLRQLTTNILFLSMLLSLFMLAGASEAAEEEEPSQVRDLDVVLQAIGASGDLVNTTERIKRRIKRLRDLGIDDPYYEGPASLRFKIWTTWSGDGPKPEDIGDEPKEKEVGEIYTLWYFQGEQNLSGLSAEDQGKTTASIHTFGMSPLQVVEKTIVPAGSPFVVAVKVFDKDRFGDQKIAELGSFVQGMDTTSENLYPKGKLGMAVIGEVLSAALRLPNLFLDNDLICQTRFEIRRTQSRVYVSPEIRQVGYCIITLETFP